MEEVKSQEVVAQDANETGKELRNPANTPEQTEEQKVTVPEEAVSQPTNIREETPEQKAFNAWKEDKSIDQNLKDDVYCINDLKNTFELLSILLALPLDKRVQDTNNHCMQFIKRTHTALLDQARKHPQANMVGPLKKFFETQPEVPAETKDVKADESATK